MLRVPSSPSLVLGPLIRRTTRGPRAFRLNPWNLLLISSGVLFPNFLIAPASKYFRHSPTREIVGRHCEISTLPGPFCILFFSSADLRKLYRKSCFFLRVPNFLLESSQRSKATIPQKLAGFNFENQIDTLKSNVSLWRPIPEPCCYPEGLYNPHLDRCRGYLGNKLRTRITRNENELL